MAASRRDLASQESGPPCPPVRLSLVPAGIVPAGLVGGIRCPRAGISAGISVVAPRWDRGPAWVAEIRDTTGCLARKSCIGQADAEDQKKRRDAMECWNRFIWSRSTSYRMVTTAGADCHRQHGAPDRGGPKLTQKGSRPNVRGEGRPISEADGQFRSHVTSNALFV